jgi:hypothetical protein
MFRVDERGLQMTKRAQSAAAPGTEGREPQRGAASCTAGDPAPTDALPTPEQIARTDAFMGRYSKWLAARAAYEDPTRPDDDETSDKLADARDEAERQLLLTPAPVRWAVWMKWEALELMITSEQRDTSYSDARTLLALGAIKVDLIRFGFGE